MAQSRWGRAVGSHIAVPAVTALLTSAAWLGWGARAPPAPAVASPVSAPESARADFEAREDLVSLQLETGALRSDLRRLETALAELGARFAAIRVATDSAADGQAGAAAERPAAGPRPSTEQRMESAASRLDRSLAQESRDPAWSLEAEVAIAGRIRAEDAAGTELLSLECQTSFCRMELSSPSTESRE